MADKEERVTIQNFGLCNPLIAAHGGSSQRLAPITVFAKTAGLSDKTGKFSICPAENFSLSDKCPVISGKKR